MILGGDGGDNRGQGGSLGCPHALKWAPCSTIGYGMQRGRFGTGRSGHGPFEWDDAHYTGFILGTPSLQAAGCNMAPILRLTRGRKLLGSSALGQAQQSTKPLPTCGLS